MREKIQDRLKALKTFLKENKVFTGYWIIFTAILLFQHTQGWNWDFLVYLMNGEYIMHSGFFMEWLRPPLAPLIMGLFDFIFSRPVTGYIYILAASTVFLYAVNKFSKKTDLDPMVLLTFLSTPVFISYATREGTELLALAFLMLFISNIDSEKSGAWLGLSVLTRWTQALMLPIILLQKDMGKIVKTGIVFCSVFVPWMIYSFLVTGDPLSSPISFIVLNLLLGSLETPPEPLHFLIMTFPSALAIILLAKEEVRGKMKACILEEKISWAMLYIAAATAFTYFASQITHLRYLFQLNLPLAYFAAKAWEEVNTHNIIYGLMAVNLLLGFQASLQNGYESPRPYQQAAENVRCMAESDSWVPLNYAGLHAESPVNDETTVRRIRNGWRILDFSGDIVKSSEELTAGELIRDEGAYKIYGIPGKCAKPVKVDNTRIDEYNTAHGTNYSETGFMINLILGRTG